MVCFQLLSCYLKYCVDMVGSLFNCAGESDKGHLRMDIFTTFLFLNHNILKVSFIGDLVELDMTVFSAFK